MTQLVIATRNRHKTQEIRAVLGEGFFFRTLADYPGAPEVAEDADTFAGNARKKATALAQWLARTGQNAEPNPEAGIGYVLADDSGLEVKALGGAPGVRSARFAAETGSANTPDAANNAKLLELMSGIPPEERIAQFRCVLALVQIVPRRVAAGAPREETARELKPELFEGVCPGRLEFSPRGQSGFGYDPLFIPDGYAETFGELPAAVKNQISHRARALAKLRDWFVLNYSA